MMEKPKYKFQIEQGVSNKGSDSTKAYEDQKTKLDKELGLKNCESVWFANNNSRHVDNDYYWLEPNIAIGDLHPEKDPWNRPTTIDKITRYVEFEPVKARIDGLEQEIKNLKNALKSTVEPLEWWTKDYPNDGYYTRISYQALVLVKKVLGLK